MCTKLMYGVYLSLCMVSLEMMCIAFIVLFLENIKLFFISRAVLFKYMCIEILADSNFCKYQERNQIFEKMSGYTSDFFKLK